MSDDKRQQNCAERLKRIEGERTRGVEPEEPVRPRNPGMQFDLNPPIESHPIRNTFIWLAFFGLIGAGGYVAFNALPKDMVAAVAGLAGFEVEFEEEAESEEAVEDAGPAFFTETETMAIAGPIFASPSVAHESLTDKEARILVVRNILREPS